jgi:hypothetical protein
MQVFTSLLHSSNSQSELRFSINPLMGHDDTELGVCSFSAGFGRRDAAQQLAVVTANNTTTSPLASVRDAMVSRTAWHWRLSRRGG